MPHLGQAPGVSLSTLSHIGQKYFFPDRGESAAATVIAPSR
jgi:hypothetical protein